MHLRQVLPPSRRSRTVCVTMCVSATSADLRRTWPDSRRRWVLGRVSECGAFGILTSVPIPVSPTYPPPPRTRETTIEPLRFSESLKILSSPTNTKCRLRGGGGGQPSPFLFLRASSIVLSLFFHCSSIGSTWPILALTPPPPGTLPDLTNTLAIAAINSEYAHK